MLKQSETLGLQIRHLVEVDTPPDFMSFVLRTCALKAQKWRILHYGAIQSILFSWTGVKGQHWITSKLELLDSASKAEKADLYFHQFEKAKSLRALRISEAKWDEALIAEFKPDIFISDPETDLLPGFYASEMLSAASNCRLSFASQAAEMAFEDILAGFSALLENYKSQARIIFDAQDVIFWSGFHAIEHLNALSWAWSGAERIGTILLPRIAGKRMRLTMFIFAHQCALTEENLVVSVNKVRVTTRVVPEWYKIEAEFECADENPILFVELHHGKLSQASDSLKELGVAINKISLETL